MKSTKIEDLEERIKLLERRLLRLKEYFSGAERSHWNAIEKLSTLVGGQILAERGGPATRHKLRLGEGSSWGLPVGHREIGAGLGVGDVTVLRIQHERQEVLIGSLAVTPYTHTLLFLAANHHGTEEALSHEERLCGLLAVLVVVVNALAP